MSQREFQWPAFLYDGKTSQRNKVNVKLLAPGYLVVQELGSLARFHIADVQISPQLASQPARVDLPDGASLEIPNPGGFYAELKNYRGAGQWLHALESRWSLVALALCLTLITGWAAYVWGIPAVARVIAYALPTEVDRSIGAEGLQLLDQQLLIPTELDEDRRESLQNTFRDVVATVGADGDYRLVFRATETLGANAFALPSGIIVLTDELVELAEHDEEIAAVLAHEIGHVRNRHSLRLLIQNSVVAGGILLLTGDVSTLSSLVAGIPTLLASAGYSRVFELDADLVARDYLSSSGIPLHYFADILVRLEQQNEAGGGEINLLATHPAAKERAANFR